MERKRIGVLCGGGDCPGLNAVIRAVVKTAVLRYGWEVLGSEDSFEGFLRTEKLVRMDLDKVRGILPKGGTILGTSNRANPFRYPETRPDGEIVFHDYSQRIIDKIRQLNLYALIVIGGDGTLTIAERFFKAGVPVIGVPKTIDNDLLATEVTFGFDTAVTTATDAIDKLHTTAESHDRLIFLELMGRNAGWIALEAGVAGGADVILIPEIPFNYEKICQKLGDRMARGRDFSILVVAEGAHPEDGQQIYLDDSASVSPRLGGISFQVAAEITRRLKMESRVIVLGHLQRGGSPSPYDRVLASRFGAAAVDLAAEGGFGRMVRLQCGQIDSAELSDAVAHQRLVDPAGQRVAAARSLGISFGN